MISIPGSLPFTKLVMMSSTPAKKSSGDTRYASQDPSIHGNRRCPKQFRLQSVLGVRSSSVERNFDFVNPSPLKIDCNFCYLTQCKHIVISVLITIASNNHESSMILIPGSLSLSCYN